MNAKETLPAVCPLDCADTCSLQVSVQDGVIAAVRGSDTNPYTRGKICGKVARAMATQTHPSERLLTPLIRVGNDGADEFQPISWAAALDKIVDESQRIIDRWGAEAIAPLRYGGVMGKLAIGSMDRRFFHRLGATRVDSSPLCAGTLGAAWEALFGDAGGIDFAELAHSNLIVVWGNNITTCNLHVTTLIRQRQKEGAKLVVIDPKRTRIAKDADLHIPLLPGTDVVLAYAIAHQLAAHGGLDHDFIAEHTEGAQAFLDAAAHYPLERAAEMCGIDSALISTFAQLWRDCRPAGMTIGVAPERNRNGGAGLRAAMSLLALTGNIGPKGAGPCDVGGFYPVTSDALTRPELGPPVREINVMDIPRLVLEPGDETPLRGLFIYNHNPVAVHPEQDRMVEALRSSDVFVVGSDLSMTDSMACADLILPAASHFEYGDVYTAYGHRYLQRSKAVTEPAGESKSNMDLFRALAARFGFEEECFKDSDEKLAQDCFVDHDGEPAEKALNTALDMTPYAEPGLLRGTPTGTPSGKIELYSTALEERSGEGVPTFKPLPDQREFIVVSPASEQRVNSTYGGLPEQATDVRCEIHPEDADRFDISHDDPVMMTNALGSITLPASINPDVRRGTLFVPKGAWMPEVGKGKTINALIPGHKDSLVGGACYYDCSVDIRRG
ncbi:molydopterin dinucleotide-binding region [Luminiphilus syltensis NOR5-1B]|uniref:Molydopterin dinucleotide-binding region n=1 Tax=Luminiphilus syltensis NOR5-1B TaxID=565045 RepID=B8KTT9_9GAMM|nr:molybdopterin-dependent oxidoreductase [Luminiphilus syltensis]EED34834.1 molydopterin dinucleotide-binding region [Luminiphilus syltensis NOR5-1B]